ncbi:hypothetical protein MM5_073 [Morganella phage vB_Mm5]
MIINCKGNAEKDAERERILSEMNSDELTFDEFRMKIKQFYYKLAHSLSNVDRSSSVKVVITSNKDAVITAIYNGVMYEQVIHFNEGFPCYIPMI